MNFFEENIDIKKKIIEISLDEEEEKVEEVIIPESPEDIEKKEIVQKVLEEVLPKIPTPEKGKDWKDGKTPTKTELKEIIKTVVPKEKDIIEKVVKKIPKPKDWKDWAKWEKWEDGKTLKFSDLTPYEKQILTWPPWNDWKWVPRWGTTWQKLSKKSNRNFDTEWTDDAVGSWTVTSVATWTGLTGWPITTTGTVALNSSSIASLALADTALQEVPSGIDATKIADGSVTNTEFQYINSLTSNAQTQIDWKQATLESGTNIKTINSTSLLGSGDISISASPWGSTTQVQFNDAWAFWWDANFIWDKTNDRLWVQATSPQVPLHVASVTWTTLNNVTTGSASLVSETLPSAPTGSTTLIAEPAAPSSWSVSFIDQWSGNYTGNWDTYDYRIYTCLDVASTYYLSQYYYDVQGIIPNDADTYNISVDWNDVTITGGTAAYYVEKQVNGGWYSAYWIFTVSNFTDSGSWPWGSTTPYPTYYQNIPSSPPTAFTGGSASGQDVGMGAFNEVPITVLMEVDSVVTINSINYVSGSPTSGSFDDTGMGTYNPEIAWTDNWWATNAIARVSQDGGSTWIYQYVGSSTSPYKFTTTGNDSDAEARWWQTYSAWSIQYDFAPYGIGTAPSGATVYSTVGSTYSATIPADSVKYIIKHSMSGGSAAPWKVVAPQASPAYGVQFSGDYFDVWYTTWWYWPNVTPQSYGFSGTNQNRDYRVYSSGSGIYSIIPLTVSTVAGSGSKSVSLSWTLPSGITTVKILRQINWGGYTNSRTVTGSSITDDSTDTGWSSTNVVVTPTSIIWGTARFDKALTTLTDEPHLAIVESGNTGTRYPKLSFGTATSSSATPVYLSHIYATSSNGYMSMVTGRVNIESSLGATTTVILGTTNIFNNGSSSTIHFQVKGQSNQYNIMQRSDLDTVYFGNYGGSDEQTAIVVQPWTSGDLGIVFKGHSSQSVTSNMIRFQSSAGSYYGYITGGAHFVAGGNVSNPWHSFYNDTDTGMYNTNANEIGFATSGTGRERLTSTGHYFWGTTTPTARLHIAAGTTAASTAPIKLTSGSLMTTPEVGAIEFLTDTLYYTRTTSTTRIEIVWALAHPTAGRVAYAGSGGFLQDTANFTYSVNRLSPTYITLAAGTATAGTAPLVLTTGTSLTTPIAWAVEYTTDDLFFTISTGTARKRILFADPTGWLTSGRVPFVTTNWRLTDDADLTFATDTLTATKIVGATSVKVGTAAGYISSDGSTGATGTFTTVDLKTVTVKDWIITSIV